LNISFYAPPSSAVMEALATEVSAPAATSPTPDMETSLPLPPPSSSSPASSPSSTPPSSMNRVKVVDGLLDSLVGVWKLQKSENFDAYLKAHGVGCVARALVAFLDFSISIARRTDGLRVIIHDYVSEFTVGVPQPLLEHPVTKRQDQSVIVNEEDGKLVCSISESGGFGSGCVDSVVGGSVYSGSVGSVRSGSAGVNEVIILEMLDSSSRIKQTLKFSHVTCHRWYVRDPNATNVAAIDVNGNADAAVAAAATTATTTETDNNAPNDSRNNNNNAANDIVDGEDTKAPNVDDKHVAKESGEAEAEGGGGGRDVAEDRKEEETAVKKKAERKNRKAKSRSRKTKGEETEELGKGEEEVGEAVKEKAKETAEETAGKATGLCIGENNYETGTENNNNDNKNNNQIEDEEDINNKSKKKGRRSGDRSKFQCLLSLALY